MDGAWGQWVNRWTAEENRHGIALRDYLIVTRAIDPVELGAASHRAGHPRLLPRPEPADRGRPVRRQPVRLRHLRHVPGTGHPGFAPQHRQGLQRNRRRPTAATGLGRREPAHDLLPQMCRLLAFDIAPNQAMRSLHKVLRNFKMPGYTVPDFRRKAVVIAVGGVYDPRIHLDDVVLPILKKWRIFERDDFTGDAAEMRDDLGKLIEELEDTCEKFEVAKVRRLERERKVAEKKAAKNLLVTSSASCRTLGPGDQPLARRANGTADRPYRAAQPGCAGADGRCDECRIPHAVPRTRVKPGRHGQRPVRLRDGDRACARRAPSGDHAHDDVRAGRSRPARCSSTPSTLTPPSPRRKWSLTRVWPTTSI